MRKYDELTSRVKILIGGEPYQFNRRDWTSRKKDPGRGEPHLSI